MTFFSTFTRRSLLQKGVMSTKLFVCVVLLCVFTFRVPCANIRYDFHIKRCWVRLYLLLFVEGLMFYLRYLCLFAHSGVQHILYWVFFCLVFSLSCCQFLWIVNFLLPSLIIRISYYQWADTYTGGLLVPEGIIRPVVSVSALAWCIRYIYYCKLQFLN
jgi:hypothetical protein